jgi:hypothetical protein
MKNILPFLILLFGSFKLICSESALEQLAGSQYEHYISKVGEDFSFLELEDGSIWNVKTRGIPFRRIASKLKKWKPGDKLGISIQTSNQALPHYFFINLDRNDQCEVEFYEEASDDLALYALDYNLHNKIITLSDGSRWFAAKTHCIACSQGVKYLLANKVFIIKDYEKTKFYLFMLTTTSSNYLEIIPYSFGSP